MLMSQEQIEQWFADNQTPSVDFGGGYTTFTNEAGESITVTVDEDGDLIWYQEEE